MSRLYRKKESKMNKKITIHQGKTEITCKDANYNEATLDDLDNHFMGLIEDKKIQCASYILAREGKIFACRSMGKLRFDDPDKQFLPDSLRYIASITKVFTTIGIMQLIEKGKIYLEQPVGNIIKEFDTEAHRDIQIFHLLTHTSGLPADPGYFLEPYPKDDWGKFQTIADIIKEYTAGPKHIKPGEMWAYSSLGFSTLGEIIARVSGMRYEEYVEKEIFIPMGLKNTSFPAPGSFTENECITTAEEIKEGSYENNHLFYALGGALSNLEDTIKLGILLLNKGRLENKRILGRKTVETMLRNHLKNTPAYCWGRNLKNWEYGLGLDISQGNIVPYGTMNHEGAGRSGLYFDPVNNLAAMYFVPCKDVWIPESMENPRSIIWSGIN